MADEYASLRNKAYTQRYIEIDGLWEMWDL